MQTLAPYVVAVGLVLVLMLGVAAVVLCFMVLRNGGECEFRAKAPLMAMKLRVAKDTGPGLGHPAATKSCDLEQGPEPCQMNRAPQHGSM
jgi:hypothetical protein